MSDKRERRGSDDDPNLERASESAGTAAGTEEPAIQALIGDQLRTMYDKVLSEPIPDKIVELLSKLESIPLPSDSDDGNPPETR
ncbi:MAG: NepR family anti-sigma factor [Pseudomonadota bacterium]